MLLINNIISSSSSVSFNYQETDKLFGLDISTEYKLDFSDVQFTDEEGVLWNGIEAIKQAYLRPNLVARIGSDEFINGRIINLSFDESTMTGSNEASITIEESKRLDDYSNNIFAQNLASPQWIENFSETCSFQRSEDNYSYTRSVSIKYKQDAGDQFLNNARLFIKNFYFTLRPNFGFQVDGISENARIDDDFKPKISETIDKINLQVSFEESFNSSKVDTDHSVKETKSISLLETGFTEKTYTVEIRALKEPLEYVANEACKEKLGQIITEANSGDPVSIEKGINGAGGVISLTVSFTNDPSKNKPQTLTYTCSKSKNGIFDEYSLSLDFMADGKNEIEKFQNVKTFWSSTNTDLLPKISFLFPDVGQIFESSNSVSFDKINGKISQQTNFTTDDSYNFALLPEGVLKRKITTSIVEQTNRNTVVFDAFDKKERVVSNGEKIIGEGTINITVVCKQSSGFWFGTEYINSLDFSLPHITSDQTSFDSSSGQTNRVINYVYTE